MTALRKEDLYTLEDYARIRGDFRRKVLEHKRDRKVALGEHATLYFEDRLTMQYQIQEMLRVERIFEEAGIMDELQAYNPLIPDGCNWKATFMIEYPDAEQRRTALAGLIGIEDRVWVQIDGHARVFAIADEDLDRETDEKTSSVHFLRMELEPGMAADLKGGAGLTIGVDHPAYAERVSPVPDNIRAALIADLD